MSKLLTDHVFTSESVSEGHPDKICDQISDAILDACLAVDPSSHVGCETLVATDFVVNAGEITCSGWGGIDPEAIARQVVREIGYTRDDIGFCDRTFTYINRIHEQSPDIAQGVNEGEGLFKEQGAGDQGMMFGYATDETPEFMPLPILLAHKLAKRLADVRKSGELAYLRPDGKTQVTIEYDDDRPVRVTKVLLAAQHRRGMDQAEIHSDLVQWVVDPIIPDHLRDNKLEVLVNRTGKFEIGGPQADTGLTGRKIIVDTYGGMGRHGGGAFSGKDPTKVDRSACYMARYIAKNIVAAGLATRCEVQLAYAIGVADPVSVLVNTFGTGIIDEERLTELVRAHFPLTPRGIIEHLKLRRPIYRPTAAFGHFGRKEETFTWEAVDKAAALREDARVASAAS